MSRVRTLGTVPLGDVLDEGARAERRRLRAIVREERAECLNCRDFGSDVCYERAIRVLDAVLARMRAPRRKR